MTDHTHLLTNAIAGLRGGGPTPPDEPLSPEDAMALAAFLIAELAPLRETRLDIATLRRDPEPEG